MALFVAGLLVASFVRLTAIDTGFAKSGITLLKIRSDELGEREKSNVVAVNSLGWQVLERVRQMPSIEAASLSFWALFEGSAWSSLVKIPGRQPDGVEVYYLEVSPGFMHTMGIRLLEGRDLLPRDVEQSAATPAGHTPVIVNEALYGGTFRASALSADDSSAWQVAVLRSRRTSSELWRTPNTETCGRRRCRRCICRRAA